MWEYRWWWGHDKHKTQPHHQYHRLLILRNDVDEESLDFNHDPTATLASAAMVLTTWLRRRRRRNLLLLALFSPLLLPFLCAAFPLLCALELCLRLRRRGRRVRKPVSNGPGRCEEGRGEFTESEVGGEVRVLLQRYLEDQLVLVVGSVYDCGDDEDDDFCSGDDFLEDCECFDSLTPV
ncbi:hypothetical protein RHMOL_Rhmol12G0008400 [Rhododendron molle]|uniref:Uncharacterized protein n=1 Tax=Rhododendron molle TaxID=49168 RepID=A0ACC0LD78_RHOML|nr:hypothetical protein RHMOL_Rhmol12G0008400 [Rhododendron molle]